MVKRSKKPKTKKIILFAILAVGLIVGTVFLIKAFSSAVSIRSLPFANGENYAFTGNGFAYISRSCLNYYDLYDENKNYSMPVNQENAQVCAGEGITVIHNSRALQVAGTQYDIEVNGTIIKICSGANYVAVLRRGDDGSFALRAYDSTGAQCYQLDLENDILTDFGFENSASPTIWISQLVSAGNSFTTTVTTYDLSRKSVTGVFSVVDQLVKNVYITKKSIFLFCTDNIIRYDRSTNNESYRILTYGYECLSASFSGGKGWFVLRNKNVDSYIIRLLTLDEGEEAGENAYLLTLPSDTLASVVMNGSFVAVSPDSLTVYTINNVKKELAVKREEEFEIPIDAALKLSENKILLTRENEQLLYSIKRARG